MPSRRATQRKALRGQRRRVRTYRAGARIMRRLRGQIHRARANIVKRRRLIRQGKNPGARAVKYLLGFVGRTEQPFGSNDAPFLAAWRKQLPSLSWMKGQPWCGFACIAAYQRGAGKRLPDDTVSTIAIANRAVRRDGFRVVGFGYIKVGDLVVFDFGSGGPKHVGLATGPARVGFVRCVEGNTSFDNSGSQANGGAVALRNRSLSLVHTVARPI